MADNTKEVTETPPPPQLSSDDNRRRTRSQTRNGGISTPPAPVAETRGRKRASQSQPGSGNKRGRKAAQPITSTEAVSSSPSKETEEHSKQAENQDLSKQKPAESAKDTPAEEKKEQDVEKEAAKEVAQSDNGTKDAEEAKKEEAKVEEPKQKEEEKKSSDDKGDKTQQKEPAELSEKEVSNANSKEECKLKTVESESKTESEPEPVKKPEGAVNLDKNGASDDQLKKEEDKPVESTEEKTPVENSCALPKKAEVEASGDIKKKELASESHKEASEAVVDEEKTQVVENKPVMESAAL